MFAVFADNLPGLLPIMFERRLFPRFSDYVWKHNDLPLPNAEWVEICYDCEGNYWKIYRFHGYTHYTFPARPLFPLVFGLFSHRPSGDEAVWKHIYKIIWRKYFFSRALLDESFYFIFLGPSLRSSSCLVLPITSNLSANSFLCCVHGFHLGKLSWWALERFENMYFPFSYFFRTVVCRLQTNGGRRSGKR